MHDNYININKEAYNKLSVQYIERSLKRSVFEEDPEILARNVLSHVLPEKRMTILEIGPGSGDICKQFNSYGHKTIAVELAEKIAHIAKRNSPNTTFITSNILDVNFLDNQFDIIYAGALIHLFPLQDATLLLSKIHKWLSSDGVFFVNTTISSETKEELSVKNDYNGDVVRFRRKWTEEDFTNFVSTYFSIVDTSYTDEVDRNKRWIGFICKRI